MTFVTPNEVSTLIFIGILVFIFFGLVAGTYFSSVNRDKNKELTLKFAGGLTLWLGLVSGVVASKVLEASPFPGLLIFFLVVIGVSLGAALSPVGRWFALGLPLPLLIAFQGFRLPLEILLHSWAEHGSIPYSMTWSGSNFDVFSGILALFLAPFTEKSRPLAWFTNTIGLVLLLNVMRIAIFSSPFPFAWPVEPPLQLGFHLPYALIVPLCIGGALFDHVVVIRKMLKSPAA